MKYTGDTTCVLSSYTLPSLVNKPTDVIFFLAVVGFKLSTNGGCDQAHCHFS